MTDDYNDIPGHFPDEVYAKKEQFVSLAMKHMTAKRMVGWLRAYADYCDVAGHDETANTARNVAKRLEYKVEQSEVDDDD